MKYSDTNKPIVCMQTNSRCYKNTGRMNPVGILWHSTGCNNPNLNRYVQPLATDANYNEMIKLLGKNIYENDWNHVSVDAGNRPRSLHQPDGNQHGERRLDKLIPAGHFALFAGRGVQKDRLQIVLDILFEDFTGRAAEQFAGWPEDRFRIAGPEI